MIETDLKTGGSSYFRPTFLSGRQYHNRNIALEEIVITPPVGERVRLDTLTASVSSTDLISIKLGNVEVVNDQLARSGNFPGFCIGGSADSGPASAPAIVGDIDESITITIVEASSYTMYYHYSFGE